MLQAIFDKIVHGELQTLYTWETQLSELGQKSFASDEEKAAAVKALWEELIDSNKIGYMALLRNLRNILQAQVSPAHIEKVAATISDPLKVENSKQLPFRLLRHPFFMAHAYEALIEDRWKILATSLSGCF